MQLSIITINYNNLAGLKKTAESVLAQTWRDFEWILIDGGSTDGSKEYISNLNSRSAGTDACLSKNPNANITYWCSEPDKEVYNAMNKGIAKANGEYLNFMNSGDCFYESSTLERVFEEKLTSDLVYGDWIRRYPDHDKLMEAPQKGLPMMLYFYNVCHQAMFIKAEILKMKGYDERFKVVADWKRWQDMALESDTFQYVPYTICIFEAGTGLSENYSLQH